MRTVLLACCLSFPGLTPADDVPRGEVKADDLRNNLTAVLTGWQELGLTSDPLAKAVKSKSAEDMQNAVDGDVGFVITINPEARVKALRGPAAFSPSQGWYEPVLVKVINEGGVTSRLNADVIGDKESTARFFEYSSPADPKRALTRKLSGRTVEYQILLLRSTTLGQREVKLTFDVGESTRDLTSRAEVPALLNVQHTPLYRADKLNLLQVREPTGETKTLTSAAEWNECRDLIRLKFATVAGMRAKAWPATHEDVRVEEEVTLVKVIRRKISFAVKPRPSGAGRVAAFLFLPKERTAAVPAVLCLHQTTKIGKAEPAGLGLKNLRYALELAERGYVTLAPDYPGYGDATGVDPYTLGYTSATELGILNHRAAVDLLASLPEVDKDRIGCIGHSLGGHNTLFVSLFDDRIKVLATSCGFCSFPKYMGGNLKGWSHKGYMPRIASVYQCDPKQLPFDFTEILAAMAPRPVFINAPLHDDNFAVDGVRDCVKAARPVYQLLGKPDHLVVEHPDCGHDFPPDVRERCYRFFDCYLRDRADSK
jgi:pimeloyl-ACP methyl ester carboxylesterase